MRVCVYGAASSEIDKVYTEAGEELGRRIAERNWSYTFGGGRSGMMGAVARGMKEKNGHILGISPTFFEENNAEITFEECSDFIHTETMRERKRELEENSDAFIVSPGGIGTFDEFFEILTLKQLGRHNKPIVIWNVDHYYDELLGMMQKSVDKKFITDDCRNLYKVCSDIDEMLDYIANYRPEDFDISLVKIR